MFLSAGLSCKDWDLVDKASAVICTELRKACLHRIPFQDVSGEQMHVSPKAFGLSLVADHSVRVDWRTSSGSRTGTEQGGVVQLKPDLKKENKMGGESPWVAWFWRAGKIALELIGVLKPRWTLHSLEKRPLRPLVGHNKQTCQRQGKEGLQARPEFRETLSG